MEIICEEKMDGEEQGLDASFLEKRANVCCIVAEEKSVGCTKSVFELFVDYYYHFWMLNDFRKRLRIWRERERNADVIMQYANASLPEQIQRRVFFKRAWTTMR